MENNDSAPQAAAGNGAGRSKSTPREHHRRAAPGETGHPRKPGGASENGGHRAGKNKTPWYRRPLVAGAVMLAVVVAAVAGALLWRHSRDYLSTDDAAIDGVMQRVSSQVAGRVLRVAVTDNEDVEAGAILVELDPADFGNQLAQARAAEAQAAAQIAEAEAQRAVAEAQQEQASASETVAQANATNAAADLQRFQDLRNDNAGAVARSQLDRAVAAAKGSAAQLRAAKQGIVAAEAQVRHAAKQVEAENAAAKSAAALVAQAELTLSHAQVKAGIAGRIARKNVAPGDFVQPGADLMAVVPREVYVTANFKETQLAHLRRGQPAIVKVDPYPDLELAAHVDSVQPATGQVFDILPSQNAAGNWVKVIQRVPVKIVFDRIPDDPDRRLAPGMSVTATVTVR